MLAPHAEEIVVAGDDAKRAREVFYKERLAEKKQSGAVDDRIVDRPKHNLESEPHVHLFARRELALGVFAHAGDQPIGELVPVLPKRLPESGIPDRANQRSAPEAAAFPVVAYELLDKLVDELIVGHRREHLVSCCRSMLEVMRDHRVEELVFAVKARVERSHGITGRLR